MNKIMDAIAVLFWVPTFIIYGALAVIGLAAVPLGLVGSGVNYTPTIFHLWGEAEEIPEWWEMKVPPLAPIETHGAIAAFALIGHLFEWWWLAIPFTLAFLTFVVCYNKTRYNRFWWLAIRNPVQGIDGIIKQPKNANPVNPDMIVRRAAEENPNHNAKFTMWTRAGVFLEYWRMEYKGERDDRNGKPVFYERRIGWKFGETKENFGPTFQWRKGG